MDATGAWLRAGMRKSRQRARRAIHQLENTARKAGEERSLKLARDYLAATDKFFSDYRD